MDDVVDDQDFNSLHRIVTGISNRNLVDEVAEHRKFIDAVDAKGRSPLWWAVWCNKANFARSLIDAEADLGVQDAKGQTPLHQCARTGSANMADILLSPRFSGDGKRRLEIPINTANQYGHCPWHSAVIKNNTPVLRVLLQHSCDFSLKTKQGTTVLHLAAKHADLSISEILMQTNLTAVDLALKHEAGYTAHDYLNLEHVSMKDRPQETIERLIELLTSTEAGRRKTKIYGAPSTQRCTDFADSTFDEKLPLPPGAWQSTF